MDYISRPSITRLARRAGIKSLSEECYTCVGDIMEERLREIIHVVVVVNSEHPTKTIMPDDVYNALSIKDVNIAKSDELGIKSVCSK